MEITQEEKNKISPFMSDLWALIKHYYTPDPDPDGPYWHDLVEESSQLDIKYNHDRLAQLLLLAFMDYIEEKEANDHKDK